MKDVIINRLTDAELDAVAELETLCFPEPWSANALQLLTSPDAVGFVCREEGRAVSYGGMLYTPFEGQITNIAVAPDKRRCGYGRSIVDALIRDAKARDLEQIALEVRASNEAAIALYNSLGFFEAGKRKHFYKNPAEDALVMLKPLKED